MVTIEVFGPGCQRCQATKKVVRQALQALGMDGSIIEVSDPKEIAKARVMFTPVVCISGEVKCSGRVPTVGEVTTWLATAAATAEGA
jgi:small redox-active disulfide protein 2